MARYAYRNTYTWTPDLAYIVGLMASDGCLINDRRHLNITSKDLEIINTFRSILEIKAKVRMKTGGFKTEAYDLMFGDVALYDFLIEIGLTPAKSLTIGKLKIPNEFYADFLRGHFDGDGTVYGYRDTRWKSSYMYYVNFYGASLPFLQWMKENNQSLLKIQKGAIRSNGHIYMLSYAKADSWGLFNAMYHPNCTYKLTRKYDKFVALLETNLYPNKE